MRFPKPSSSYDIVLGYSKYSRLSPSNPLAVAIYWRQVDMVRDLIDKGANVNRVPGDRNKAYACEDPWYPIYWLIASVSCKEASSALMGKWAAILQMLIQEGMMIDQEIPWDIWNSRSKWGPKNILGMRMPGSWLPRNALTMALIDETVPTRVLRSLLEAGSDPKTIDITVLDLFLKNVEGNGQNDPLNDDGFSEDTKVVITLLLTRGLPRLHYQPPVYAYKSYVSQTKLDFFTILFNVFKNIDVLHHLKKANVTICSTISNLDFALIRHHSEKVTGPELDKIHETHKRILKLLLDHGMDPNARNYRSQSTALHWLCWSICWATRLITRPHTYISFLLQHGADINAIDDTGITPLHYATEDGNKEHVAALLEANPPADLNINDNDGQTALDCARHQKHNVLVTMLQAAEHVHETDIPQPAV
ncbi:ankyrin repeat-containing domain protein [Xylariales sp. AK1849]|nr:ankyrin repeat-containing domain protein [Xylariales sp. AK1849]